MTKPIIHSDGKTIAVKNRKEVMEANQPAIKELVRKMSSIASKPTIPEVLPLIKKFYAKPGNEAGGLLHVVLDDHNIEDVFIRHSIKEAVEQGDDDALAIGYLLLKMSKTQRKKLARSKRN